MADNVNITPGVGASVAADEIDGALYQRVKPVFGDDGTATDPSITNPFPVAAYGEVLECLEAIRMRIGSLAASLATLQPDASGKMRVAFATDSSMNAITQVGTVGTQASYGFAQYSANDHIPALLRMSADNLRRNITVT